MALNLLVDGDGVERVTNLVQAVSDYTVCFWYRYTEPIMTANYRTPWVMYNSGYTAWVGIFSNSSEEYYLSIDNGTDNGGVGVEFVSEDFETHFAYVRSEGGTKHEWFI